jgi:hypothetical protein
LTNRSNAIRVSLLALATISLGACGASSSGSAKFQATATAVVPYSSSVVGVAFQVKDIGNGAGAPSCVVTAAASATNGGTNGVALGRIGPDHLDYEAATDDRVTVTGNVARSISIADGGGSVKCT